MQHERVLNSSEHYWRLVINGVETLVYYNEEQRIRESTRLSKVGGTFMPIPEAVYKQRTNLRGDEEVEKYAQQSKE